MPSSPVAGAEPFPALDQPSLVNRTTTAGSNDSPESPSNRPTASSSISSRLRRASLSFEQSELPEGFMAATGTIASSIFTRQAAPRPAPIATPLASSGAQRAGSDAAVKSTPVDPVPEESHEDAGPHLARSTSPSTSDAVVKPPPAAAPFANGYHFPPKHSFGEATKMGLIGFWNYTLTPVGFFVTIYGLNVVAWGGMLFLLLCNASPAMCHPSCDDIESPRRKWVEWDSQIVNALFCVTGFGLAPWRFRDLYFLIQYRILGRTLALRKLAGIHRGWFRLRGSQELPSELGPRNIEETSLPADSAALPQPYSKIPDAPLTGVRAPPTRVWKMDLVVCLMVANTFLQCVLCGFMWGMNRYNRPSWATGTFVALGCIVAAVGGIIMFIEGKSVKGIEGVPISQQDLERLERDRELGIFHYNNIKDKDLEHSEKEKHKEHKKQKESQRAAIEKSSS